MPSQITLHLGDSLTYMAGMAAGSVDAVVTDPPYNVGLDYSDGDNRADYAEWITLIVAELRRISPLVMISPGIRNMWIYPKPDWVYCWAKPGSTRRSDGGGFNEWEPFLLYGKRKVYHDLDYLPTVSNLSRDSFDHPCPKPIKLMVSYVLKLSDFGADILDPFMGSGTTGVACVRTGRNFIGCEISESYFQIAEKRIAAAQLQPPLIPHERVTAAQSPLL